MIKTIFTYAPFLMVPVLTLTYGLRTAALLPRHRVRLQAAFTMLMLLAAAKFLCFREFGGDAFSPVLPEKLIWFWDWAYSGAVILCILEGLSIIVRLKDRGRKIRALLYPLLAWGISAWGVVNGIVAPEVRELTLEYADLPAALDGYRIVQLTDLHVSSSARRWRTEEIVRRANALAPDLICLTGDFVDGTPRHFRRDLEPIKDLRAKDGVFAVTGNHEYYHPWNEWSWYLLRWNIRVLKDETVFPHEGLALSGVEDRERFASGYGGAPFNDYENMFGESGAEAGAETRFKILLKHRPSRAGRIAAAGCRLQLSGHTHGGIMPLMDRLVARYNGGFVRGLYELDGGARLYVAPGSGQWAGFPVRFFNPSEITLITLKKK